MIQTNLKLEPSAQENITKLLLDGVRQKNSIRGVTITGIGIGVIRYESGRMFKVEVTEVSP